MYYSLIGTLLTVIIGIIGSYLTQDPKDTYDAKLLHPLVFKFHQRFTGEKPYYVKEIETIAVGSNGNISNCGIDGGNAKINHAFEAQNETNIIIGVGNNSDKEKNPMEVIFTKPTNGTMTTTATATATAITNSNTETNLNLEMSKTQNIFSNPSADNKLLTNDVTGSYRQINEKENV